MKLGRLLRRWDVSVAGTSLVVLVSMTVAVIVLRTVFSITFMGADELSRYLLICVVFLAVAAVTRSGEHIRMGELAALLPQPARTILQLVVAVLGLLSFGVVTVSTLMNTLDNLGTATPALSMPYPVFFAPTLIGFFLVTIEYLISIVRLFSAGRSSTGDRDDRIPDTGRTQAQKITGDD